MQFNYSNNSQFGEQNVSPELDKPYGIPKPRIQSQGNLRYRQFIDLIKFLWSKGHPEVDFVAFKDKHIYSPDKGYVIYSIVRASPADNYAKPHIHDNQPHPDDPKLMVAIFIQTFNYYIKFTAVHQEPEVAEEILENFEDFMMEITPVFSKLGLENFAYGERPSDETRNRYGEDLAARSVIYRARIQKIMLVEQAKLLEIYAQVNVMLNEDIVDPYDPRENEVTSEGIKVIPRDFYTGATPSS